MSAEVAPDQNRLNWKQACAILGCSKAHFYRLVSRGILPSTRLGRRKGIKVHRDDVEEYLQSLAVQA